ncbi:MAG: DUF438 domain-containing protein [Chloroflexi bacterium]|nr:DUF438 domain-containing protein [Chloroflexota bacterium]
METTQASIRTIDVKGLDHARKEGLIFPSLEALTVGQTLRIIVEFNPLPLAYMLKAQGEFELSYEKEGPDEWILVVRRVSPVQQKKEQFKELLKEMKTGEVSESAREKARKLLQGVDAATLGIMEQELLQEGVSHEEIRGSLCDIHLEVLRDSLVAKRIEVSAPHPVNTLMEEHKVIISTLNELGGLIERLKGINDFAGLGADEDKLKDISHHLVEAESHHQREEEVLFPRVEKHGITEPPQIMVMDHVEFRKRKQALYQVAHNARDYSFPEFKGKVTEYGKYLVKELESHIFKEDNILYQIALQLLTPVEWDEVKKGCDNIGYCCFTPQDVAPEVVELDLRSIMPFERHDLIFEKWEALKPGQTLRIINDHDPKPLRYQFEVEYKDQYEWTYEQKGPRDWKVTIKKTRAPHTALI